MSTYLKFHASTVGSNEVIPAPGVGNMIVVMACFLQCSSSTSLTIKSGTATDLTGAMQFSSGGGLNLPYSGISLFECAENEAFCFDMAGIAPSCGGALTYNIQQV